MPKQKVRRQKVTSAPTVFEQARDEMFQHIMRCGVIGSEPEHQAEWFNDTMPYLADRFHELSASELAELRTLGERFSQPAKAKPVEMTVESSVEASVESTQDAVSAA
jgi:hypothetical protein